MADDRQVAPDPRLSELVETWRERERALCRKADAEASTQYAQRLAAEAEGAARCADELAAVLLGGTPRSLPDDPPTVLTIEVEREDDGRCCASWVTGDHKEAGSGEYSPTIVGALANLCATLIKVDEDKAIELAACGGAASSPTSERELIAAYVESCREDDKGRRHVQVFDVLAKQIRQGFHLPAAPVRPVQEPTI